MTERDMIVAELHRNWGPGHPTSPLIAQLFEDAIAHNAERGYRLHSFKLSQLMTSETEMSETIIAVFERC